MSPSACPICRRPAFVDYRPFCSRRCAEVDLQRWFSGAYALPAEAADADETGAGQAAGRPGSDPL